MKYLAVISFALLLVACDADNERAAERDAETLLRDYGCGSCHVIPGVPGANGRVGPSLERIARRGYIGGVLPNTHENMVRWLLEPQAVDPRTAMPDTGVSEQDARVMADYLSTLE